MKNTFGNNVTVTVFGESHGCGIGVVIDGLAPGLDVDIEYINKLLALRRPSGNISTSRREADEFVIQSGVFEGKTCGTPICITIPNADTRSKDYSATRWLARPSHADYTANCKYKGFEDYRGGGHFSGRITAALVAAGGIVLPALAKKGILVGTHIKKCAQISDRDFSRIMTEGSQWGLCDFIIGRLDVLHGNHEPRTAEEIGDYAEKYLGVDRNTLNFEYTVDKTPDGRYVRIGRGSTSYYHTVLSEEIRDSITVVTIQFWADPSQTVPSRKVEFHLELIDGEYKPLHTVILEDSSFKTATAST